MISICAKFRMIICKNSFEDKPKSTHVSKCCVRTFCKTSKTVKDVKELQFINEFIVYC